MSLAFWLYMVDLCASINAFCISLCLMYGVALFCTILERYGNDNKEPFDIVIKKWWLALLVALIAVFAPTKQTMYLMLGSSYLQQSGLPSKVVEALDLKLDDVIKDLRKDKG